LEKGGGFKCKNPLVFVEKGGNMAENTLEIGVFLKTQNEHVLSNILVTDTTGVKVHTK
jgi:hypothetical protein